MISVGCDFGLRKSGVVLLDEDFEIRSQNLIRVPETSRGAQRLVEIERGFDAILRPYANQEMIVFLEGYAYGAKHQRESLAELGGVMRRYLYLSELTFWVIPPTSLKYFVTGTGAASKNYMKKCTRDRWDLSFKSDDVCDAYGMSRLAMNVMKALRGEPFNHLEDHEQSIVQEILTNQEIYLNANTARRKKKQK